MLKLLDLDSSYFSDEPMVRILDTDVSSGFLKVAADSRISEFASSIKPDSGKVYVHILAMGAGEFYGANRNADYFPEENLKNYHQTFETSPAHIFQHHINKNPEIAIGKVVHAIYNERMHRVEVVAWIDREKGKHVVEKIDAGQFPATSMACHTPFDTCAICQNKARSREQYCEHLRDSLGKILPDGRKVMAINDGPLKFFDMSIVFRPADVTSSVLQKLAYAKAPAVSSLDSAEAYGLQEKAAEMKKISELIKEVEGSVVGSSSSLSDILARVKDPADSVLDLLAQFDLHHVIHALAELGISPSVGFFAKLIGQKISGGPVAGVERLVQGLLQEEPGKLSIPTAMPELEKSASYGVAKVSLVSALVPFVKQSSLFPSLVWDRASGPTPAIQRPEDLLFPIPHGVGPGGNMGYAGTSVDPRVSYRALQASQKEQEPGLLKTLFLIGGAAIAAKWLLSKMIESKIKEHNEQMRHVSERPVKIVLVKSAQEVLATRQLVRASLLQGLRGH